MKITRYGTIIRSSTNAEEANNALQREVMDGIALGWEPLGGVSLQLILTEREVLYMLVQAMVLRRGDDDDK